MADVPSPPRHSLRDTVQMSGPVDLHKAYDIKNVKGQTVVITGGASGFGAGFFERWAAQGACVVIGDINSEKGEALVADTRKKTGNQHLHFVRCDVTVWSDQVALFRTAARVSPHGGIDHVVANAGIASGDKLQVPLNLDVENPPPPNLKIVEVNLIGVLYTTHLAFYYLGRNKPSSDKGHRDRHLLLVGSLASLTPLPSQPLYGSAKHGVMGLFRSLRGSGFVAGIRVNILCPYYIDTPLLQGVGRMVLAGTTLGKPEDVVDAGSRFVADDSIRGRGLVVGPKVRYTVNKEGETVFAPKNVQGADVQEGALFEAYADDFEDSDASLRAIVGILNSAAFVRGWIVWGITITKVLMSPLYRVLGWKQ